VKRALLTAVLAVALAAPPTAGADLRAEWFSEVDLTGPVLDRSEDTEIDHYWGFTDPVWVDDTFSVRWTGRIQPHHSQRHTFYVTSDDGVRLWIDGKLVVDNWTPHTVTEDTGEIDLVGGRQHDLRLEFFDSYGEATIKLEWESASTPREVVPAERLSLPLPPAPASPPAGHDPREPKEPAAPSTPPVRGTIPTLPVPTSPLLPPATPLAGRTFNAQPARGTVMVRLPGSRAAVPLAKGASLPVGSRVDATRGAVRIETAPGAGVKTRSQSVLVWGAVFTVTQVARGDRIVTLDVRDTRACPKRTAGRARAAARGRRPARLWAQGKGRFRIRGRHAAATVRGTTWSVEDACDRTITRVRTGVVAVRDFRRAKTVLVRAGQRHVAAARRAKRS
jgi:hypothetical protein